MSKEEKIVMVGEIKSGKTSFLHRVTKGYMSMEKDPKIDAKIPYTLEVSPTERHNLMLWDTSGSELYYSLFPAHFRDAKAAIIAFDSSVADSLTKLGTWIEMTRIQGGPEFPFVLVGMKCDKPQAVKREDAQKIADEQGCPLLYCSASTGEGIIDVLKQAVLAKPVKFINPMKPGQKKEDYVQEEPKVIRSEMTEYRVYLDRPGPAGDDNGKGKDDGCC